MRLRFQKYTSIVGYPLMKTGSVFGEQANLREFRRVNIEVMSIKGRPHRLRLVLPEVSPYCPTGPTPGVQHMDMKADLIDLAYRQRCFRDRRLS